MTPKDTAKRVLVEIRGIAVVCERLLELEDQIPNKWFVGHPDRVYGSEWFIADTKFGPMVLKELPKDFTYDYRTADETYVKKDTIKRWMQFPDSEFIPFTPV